MRYMHISDLHLGKKLGGRDLEEDQRHILGQIMDLAQEQKVDGLIVAGDIFDDGTSSTVSAVNILDWFLTELAERDIETYMISGNHDSMDRLHFGSELFRSKGIHIVSRYEGEMIRYVQRKDDLTVGIYLLPFIKPVHARNAHPEDRIESYEDAVRSAISHTELVDGEDVRIAVTHQFVTNAGVNPERCDSEKVYVGTTENVDISVFDDFDYVALGHIHRPQDVGSKGRYCGTPLKYSVSEAGDEKSVTVLDVSKDGVNVSTIPLVPLRDLKRISGPLEDIIAAGKTNPHREDYYQVDLTDNPDNPMDRIREVYPNVIGLTTPTVGESPMDDNVAPDEDMDPISALKEFYRRCTGTEPSEYQMSIVEEIMGGGDE